MSRVRIQTDDFDISGEVAALLAGDFGVGAVATFTGTVRDRSGGGGDSAVSVQGRERGPQQKHGPEQDLELELELEHYPGMTERAIEAMIDAALQRFDIRAARVVHRVGRLRLGEQIVLVAVASAHRGPAFQACEFLMDYLKTQAPFWKKETGVDGGAHWVDARVADDAALQRWGISAASNV